MTVDPKGHLKKHTYLLNFPLYILELTLKFSGRVKSNTLKPDINFAALGGPNFPLSILYAPGTKQITVTFQNLSQWCKKLYTVPLIPMHRAIRIKATFTLKVCTSKVANVIIVSLPFETRLNFHLSPFLTTGGDAAPHTSWMRTKDNIKTIPIIKE